jgi:serine/threonine protein kinase/tetratricopeptide (TPR) repeat protein
MQIGRYSGTAAAEGGFATVFHATDPVRGIPVAVKWAHASADDATIVSLHHEFQLLGEFDCARLPRALDFGWAEKRPYLVTDWIEGPDLWEHPHAGSEGFFVEVLRQIARALLSVHHRGWVHGDLKPANFRWGPPRIRGAQSAPSSGHSLILYLLDFGLARRSGDTDRPRGAGTVGYYAPEFLNCLPADGRADWYSVGAILYEWLFGRRPFAAEDPANEIAGHLEQSPSMDLPLVRPAPQWAKDVIARLLAKMPDERARDIYELLQWLGQFDSELTLETILNEQLHEHHHSETRRLDDHDRIFLEQVRKSTRFSERVRWFIAADQIRSAKIARGFIGSSVGFGPGARIEGAIPESPAGASIEARLNHDRLPLGAGDSNGVCSTLTLDFAPMPECESPGTGNSGVGSVCAVTLLPWDAERVAEHLLGLTHDEAFTRTHAQPVWKATGGLPGVVESLLSSVIESEQLKRVSDGWELDESAIARWQSSPEACSAFNEYLGAMTADERRLCDWLAVGRSQVRRDLLLEFSALSDTRFDSALDKLVARGLVIFEDSPTDMSRPEIRFRHGGISDVWRAQLPAVLSQKYAATLADRLERAEVSPSRAVEQALAECFADAQQWAKCAEHAIKAANLNVKIERNEDAWRYIQMALSAATQVADQITRAHWLGRALMARGDCQKSFGQIDDARRTYAEILALGRRHHDLHLLAETLKDLGDLYKIRRQFEKGVRVLRRARQLWETIGNREEVARTLLNLGNMFWVASDRSQARRYYEEALELARSLHADEVVALVLSNLGVVHKSEHDFARAEAYYRESLAIKERLNVPIETARTLNNLGVIALDQGHLEEAVNHLEKALEINSRVGAKAEAIFNRGNLIHVALERGDLRTVIEEGQKTTDDTDALGDTATAAELRGLLAEAFIRAGDFRLAQMYLNEARQQAAGQRNSDLDAHLGLVEAIALWRIGLSSRALAILTEVGPLIDSAELPRLRIDAMVLRMKVAVAADDIEAVERLWQEGQAYAKSIHAPHKLAQLAFARLSDNPSHGYLRDAFRIADEFLKVSPGWHWEGPFHLWNALRLQSEDNWEAAEREASGAVARLQSDGNWEVLWRALTVYGQICDRRADYQPALAAFDQASHILDEISKTITDADHRELYLAQPRAKGLTEARSRIVALTN